MAFEITPEVEVHRDAAGNVTQLKHGRRGFTASDADADMPDATPIDVADQYVREVADLYDIPGDELTTLAQPVDGAPTPEQTRLKRAEERTVIDTTVVKYEQTHLGLPVWNSSLTVVVAGDPPAVVNSSSTLHHDVEVDDGADVDQLVEFGATRPASLSEAIGVDDAVGSDFELNDVRLLVYQYDPDERIDPEARPPGPTGAGDAGFDPDNPPAAAADFTDDAGDQAPSGTGEPDVASSAPLRQGPPTLPLPPMPADIVPGRHYVVREVLFSLAVDGEADLHWRAFVEPRTEAVLYLRALTADATCAVFETDPVSRTGSLLTAGSPAAELDAARTLGLTVENLDPPTGGSQVLDGKWARIRDLDPPNVAPPEVATPFSFTYSAVTDDFAAANAYYHTDWMYRLVEGMGFDLSTYFDGTSFPVPVDHRGKRSALNASANGNAAGNGMGKFLYGVAQRDKPVGIATTARVCLHEFGHALLWDHVNSPNFGWAHSAGDTLAAILHDPGSKAPDRFETFPFVTAGTPGVDRRHDRDVAAGWAWGGTRDDRQYGSEQILSTLLFRVYRVTGGDDADIEVQRFAARYLAYLIIRAIGTLTTVTRDPRVFVTALEQADEQTTDFGGHPGGAWHKVIRWSFEKQGLFQPPGAPTPVTGPGAPPDVDVFIDDGRAGEYTSYPTDIGASPGVWNRRAADGGTANEDPVAGTPNSLYVRVANRGTETATNVVVKAYQGAQGTALQWPGDWMPLTTASIAAPDIAAGADAVVGPFEWTPATAGPISVLASVEATGDASNADTVNGPISNRLLVPNDNNLAQRDLTVSGGGGGGGTSLQICSGSTTPGATAWRPYRGVGVVLDVDTSACGFTRTPRYFTSIGGRSSHWATTGATSIYDATPTGFRVYVRWSNGKPLTPAQANGYRWHINWTAVGGE